MKEKNILFGSIKTLAMILGGNTLYALTVQLFLIPSNIMSSGTTGIALIVRHLTGLQISTFVLGFNIFMLIMGLCFLGKKFVMTTIVSSLYYPVILGVFEKVLADVAVTDNMLLNTLYSGLGIGMALGIVMRAGASTGGMDIPPLVLNKYFKIPVSVSLYVFDFIIVSAQIFFHPLEDLLYGIILLLTTSIMLYKMMLLGTTKTELKIISQKTDEIRKGIIEELDRGVTLLNGESGYMQKDMQLILSVVSNRELVKMERLIRSIDPDCFMIVNRVSEVWGRGFSREKKYHN